MLEQWSHVFKLDPNKTLSDNHLQLIAESGTDAIVIGGTDGITFENVTDLLDRLEPYPVPVWLEVSDLEAIAPGFDGYLVPFVLNSRDKRWACDVQHQAIREYGDMIPWNAVRAEGYCVMNEAAKVFQKTDCSLPSRQDVIAYAQMAEHLYRLPFFYLEYSGIYGDPEIVQQVANELQQTKLIYGGGISTRKQAEEMLAYADTIVVGNVIYENMEAALETVVK